MRQLFLYYYFTYIHQPFVLCADCVICFLFKGFNKSLEGKPTFSSASVLYLLRCQSTLLHSILILTQETLTHLDEHNSYHNISLYSLLLLILFRFSYFYWLLGPVWVCWFVLLLMLHTSFVALPVLPH